MLSFFSLSFSGFFSLFIFFFFLSLWKTWKRRNVKATLVCIPHKQGKKTDASANNLIFFSCFKKLPILLELISCLISFWGHKHKKFDVEQEFV